MLGSIFCTIGKALGGCICKTEDTSFALVSAGAVDINEMSSILLDKLEEIGDVQAELYLPDSNCKVYRKDDVIKFLGLDETDKITYVAEFQDCDDFAAEVFGLGLGLLWTNVHALCWFVSDDKILWFVEPQTDQISQALDDWQGYQVRFFLGR